MQFSNAAPFEAGDCMLAPGTTSCKHGEDIIDKLAVGSSLLMEQQ